MFHALTTMSNKHNVCPFNLLNAQHAPHTQELFQDQNHHTKGLPKTEGWPSIAGWKKNEHLPEGWQAPPTGLTKDNFPGMPGHSGSGPR